MPIIAFGSDIIRCCMNWYAHFKAVKVGDRLSEFFESLVGGLVSIDLLTSMAKSTASLTVLYPLKESVDIVGDQILTHTLVDIFLVFVLCIILYFIGVFIAIWSVG